MKKQVTCKVCGKKFEIVGLGLNTVLLNSTVVLHNRTFVLLNCSPLDSRKGLSGVMSVWLEIAIFW